MTGRHWYRYGMFISGSKSFSRKGRVAMLLTHTHDVGNNLDYAFQLIGTVIEHVRENSLGDFATPDELIANRELRRAVQGKGPDILEAY